METTNRKKILAECREMNLHKGNFTEYCQLRKEIPIQIHGEFANNYCLSCPLMEGIDEGYTEDELFEEILENIVKEIEDEEQYILPDEKAVDLELMSDMHRTVNKSVEIIMNDSMDKLEDCLVSLHEIIENFDLAQKQYRNLNKIAERLELPGVDSEEVDIMGQMSGLLGAMLKMYMEGVDTIEQ